MKASLQLISVPVYVIRLHEDDDGDPLFLDDYVGLAVVVPRGDLGVVQGFSMPNGYDKQAREAIRDALRSVGITHVRSARVIEKSTQGDTNVSHKAHDFENAYMPIVKDFVKVGMDLIKHNMEEQRKIPGVTAAMMAPWDNSMAEYVAFAKKFGLH